MQGEVQNAALPLAGCLHPQHSHEVQHHHDVRTKQAFVYGCNSALAKLERCFFQLFLCTQSIIICCFEQQHLPLSPTPMVCPPSPSLPVCNDAVSFDTGVVYFKSSPSLVFSEASWQLSRHGSVSQIPSHSTTAQL